MSKLITVLFVFFSAIVCAFGAMMLSRLFISKSSGLAGGAEVLGWGIMGLVGGIVLALVLKNKISPGGLKTATLILGLGSIAAVFFLGIKANTNKSPVDTPIPPKQETNAPDRM